MNAFHACSSAPFYATAEKGARFRLEAFELLCMALSALTWRANGGSIRLFADAPAASYLRRQGLGPLWDGGIDDSMDDALEGLNPRTFWAAGKLLALDKATAPCVMLDMDFIVWRDLTSQLMGDSLVVAHREELYPSVYPPPDSFWMQEGYTFPADYDPQALPCNTAFAYFGDEELRREYVREALRFMHAARGTDSLTYMVFAEQRLLAMLCAARGLPIGTLLPMDGVFAPQRDVTHLWGHKRRLREDVCAREDFIRRCLLRIHKDFADLFPLIAAAEEITPYAKRLL